VCTEYFTRCKDKNSFALYDLKGVRGLSRVPAKIAHITASSFMLKSLAWGGTHYANHATGKIEPRVLPPFQPQLVAGLSILGKGVDREKECRHKGAGKRRNPNPGIYFAPSSGRSPN